MRKCIHCGCTNERACTEVLDGRTHTCQWVTMSEDGLTGECSACVDDEGTFDDEPSLILPGDPEFHL